MSTFSKSVRPTHHQYSLRLIEHRVEQSVIQQRSSDGYINATELCKAAGKRWHNYVRNETTGNFLRALAARTRISVPLLNQHVTTPEGVTSMWVHPKVAIHLGQWLSADFAVQVTEWVYDWMSGRRDATVEGVMPYHLERHMANVGKIPATHFSILQEITVTLIAPLEAQGYRLPAEMVPDISQGLTFCRFAREELGIDTDTLPTYLHEYPDGRTFQAKLYPVEHLGRFRTFINQVWMPQYAERYFRERDPKALPLLDKIMRITVDTARRPRLPPKPPKPSASAHPA